jgi:hypothetical protein
VSVRMTIRKKNPVCSSHIVELCQSASYVHAKGFESEQMEQMILQYVKAHGRVTRQDIMELCRVNENQAAYLLKKLVKSEELRLVGKGRSAAYTSLKSELTRKNMPTAYHTKYLTRELKKTIDFSFRYRSRQLTLLQHCRI